MQAQPVPILDADDDISKSSVFTNPKQELSIEESAIVYRWIDKIPLSRPKKNIARDFADCVLMSEVIAHFFPRLVELHNYVKTNAIQQKRYNWETLNQKVLRKMGFQLNAEDILAVVNCEKGAIERVLRFCQIKMADYLKRLERKEEDKKSDEEEPDIDGGQQPSLPVSNGVNNSYITLNNSNNNNNNNNNNNSNSNSSSSNNNSKGAGKGAKSVFPPLKKENKSSLAAAGPAVVINAVSSGAAAATSEKDQMIADLKETVDILQLKVEKLEQLLKLKNSKIATLQEKLEQMSKTSVAR